MDMNAIAAVTTALTHAFNITQEAINLRDEAKLAEAMAGLHAQLTTAQSHATIAQATILEFTQRYRQLEEEVAALKSFAAEAAKYQLGEIAPGILAYAPRPDAGAMGPAHYLCTNCFGSGKKSILQKQMRAQHRLTLYVCPHCKTELSLNYGR